MRRIELGKFGILAAGLAAAALLGAGGSKPAQKKRPSVPLKVDETVSDLAILRYNDKILVEGVGLVIGLDGTGSEAEPSIYRTKLLDIMRKARVEHAETWLASPMSSVVIVKGTVPVGITAKDHFDIDLELTPASTTKSLAGGYLIATELRVVQRIGDKQLEGHPIATAGGPVVVGRAPRPVDAKASLVGGTDDPKFGRVLGGARVRKDLPYTLVLKDERKSGRTSKYVQDAINFRFHQLKGIEQKGMAVAKTDQIIILNVPKIYHHNQFRYFQVVEHLPVIENAELRAQRQALWGSQLLDPKTAGLAALKLEGIGRNATELLQAGLTNPNAQVRFFAAEALAYLNDASGVEVLEQTVKNSDAFRAYALAALAALDQPAATLCLQRLMGQADPTIRYGAFNALRTISEDEPYLGRVRVLRDDRDEAERDNALAMLINSPPTRRVRRLDDPFALYVVDCEGPPMIHVARTRRCEIVLFGKTQKLLTPAVLGGAGPILINAAVSNGDSVEVSRIAAGGPDDADLKVTCPATVAEVIREAAMLGATYPNILRILKDAEKQKNLPGPLIVDAVPDSVGAYDEAQLAGVDTTAKKDDAVGRTKLESGKRAGPRLLDRLLRRAGR